MGWVLGIAVAWLVLAVAVALLIGRGIRLADRKVDEEEAARAVEYAPNFVVDDAGEPAAEALRSGAPDAATAPAEERPPVAERQSPTLPNSRPPVIGPCIPAAERSPTQESGLR
jgi:hypothetical protein